MSYLGNPIISTDFPKDTFSGTGSATAFTMSIAPASVNAVIVAVSGVVQEPSTYTISGTTLTFSGAPPSGTNNISVRHLGVAGIPNVPADASVTTAKLAANTVTPAKMANGGAEFGMRNRIINGAMVIDQRNAGASVTIANAGAFTYTLDRWAAYGSQLSKFSVQQTTTSPTGFVNSLKATSTSAYSVTSTDSFYVGQAIEGYNIADLGWGTANAKTVTLSFQVYSSLTGTFGGSIQNSGFARSYPFTYTISAANTWTTISVTISGDTSGTWLTTNGFGLFVCFGLGVGSTYSGTAGSWASANYASATGATSVVGTSGATFYITGVQLEVGSSATGFEYRQYGQELALCQRYFSKSFATETAPVNGLANPVRTICAGYSSDNAWSTYIPYVVTMRTTPTMTIYSGDAGATAGQPATYDGGTWISVTSNAIINGYNNGFGLSLVKAGGFSNQSTRLVMFNYTASAEL